MKQSFSVKNVFDYIAKRFYIIAIFLVLFLMLGFAYANVSHEKFELPESGKYFICSETITLLPPENMDLVELERFNSITVPAFANIVNSDYARNLLYNNMRDNLVDNIDEWRAAYPRAATIKDVFDYSFVISFSNNNAVIFASALSEENAQQYIDEYISYILPNLENLLGDYTIQIDEGLIYEMFFEETLTAKDILEDTADIVIMFVLLGILVGLIVTLIMYALSGTVRNEFDLKSVFTKLPVLAVFKEKRKNLSQAASNLNESLKTLEIDNYIMTAPDILKPKEKVYILEAAHCSPEKFDDFADQTEKFYQNAGTAQGVIIAAKRFKTEIDALRNLVDSLNLNKINIIGFILFN